MNIDGSSVRRYRRPRRRDGCFAKDGLLWARFSHDQAARLKAQAARLERYCADAGTTDIEVVTDLGGLNYRKKGLQRLLGDIVRGSVARLVLVMKDRLLRFGSSKKPKYAGVCAAPRSRYTPGIREVERCVGIVRAMPVSSSSAGTITGSKRN